jgi:murein DD-endopeptidase MepM/ murein hydrolase activator NlpD
MRRLLPNTRWLAGIAAVAALVLVAAATGAIGKDSKSTRGEPARPAPEDVVLGGLRDPAGVPDDKPRDSEPSRPEPRRAPRSNEDEKPPQRILDENRALRRELDHLKTLEAERRRVSGTLALAAADFDGPLRLGGGGLAWPVNGPVVSPFGQRWGRLHAGIDIASPAGTVIRAAQSGRVVISAPTGGYGNYVCLQHTAELNTCYAHLSRFLVGRGAAVRQGSPIGLVGCTGHCFGDHLHFETWVNQQPVDPMVYL